MKKQNCAPSAIRLFARAAAAATVCAGLGGAFAVAQDAPAGGAMRGPGMGSGHEMRGMEHAAGGMGGMAGMMNHMLCGPTEHVEGKLAYLKAELKLTDQQQAAWNSFADAYRAAMHKTAATCASMMSQGGDHEAHHGVLGHLSMMEHHMTDHLDEIRAAKAALEPFYATLNEEQKKFLDHAAMHVLGLMGGMGGGMMGGMMGGMGEGGGMGGMKH